MISIRALQSLPLKRVIFLQGGEGKSSGFVRKKKLLIRISKNILNIDKQVSF